MGNNIKCAIVISTHKEFLESDELKSFRRCIQVYGKKYDIFINTKKSNNVDFYLKEYDKIKIQRQDDIFFNSYQNCATMHRSIEFYSSFKEYQYILTRQLDVWDLYDNLDYFINLGYDYYGAPVVNCPSWGSLDEIVGCGGCALRKVDKFQSICDTFYNLTFIDEDLWFSTYKNKELNICPVDVALQFCFSAETTQVYEYWYKKTNFRLPSFVHIYKKNDTWNFWKRFIDDSRYEVNGKIHFITFSNSDSGFSFERIKYEAEEMKCFETIETYTEKNFDEKYWNKNKHRFCNSRGYGYWSWKPYFIKKKLETINYGDIIVYADTGCMLVAKNRNTIFNWCQKSKDSDCGILSPCYGPYFERNWTKGNAFKYVNDNYNKKNIDIFYNSLQCGAGILVITKTKKSIEFIDIWNDIMENHYELCTDDPSDCENHPQFIEHRHDQSIFSMLSKIFGVEYIKSKDGILNKEKSPIICTRIRNDKKTWRKPIKVLYDNQIFDEQTFGGLSRMFTDVIVELDSNEIYEKFQQKNSENLRYSRTDSIIGINNTNNEHLIQSGFIQKNLSMTNSEYCEQLKRNGNYDIFFPTFFDHRSIENIGNRPFVMFIPDMISEIYFNPMDRQNIGKKIMSPKASAIITPSFNSKLDIMKYLDIPEEKIHVIYHNLSKGFGESYQEKSIVDFPYILYVGNRILYKNFYIFLKHSIEFLKNHTDYKILCTGPRFGESELNIIRQFGLSGRIAYYHAINDYQMASLYRHAKMFVFPSEYEGFGIPILESFKMKCPTLLNNRSCFPEIAKDSAVFFDMDNEKSNIVEKMEYVISMNDQQHDELIIKQTNRFNEIQQENFFDKFYNVLEKVYLNI